jgi:hypothetical protein
LQSKSNNAFGVLMPRRNRICAHWVG